jgi:phosphoribosylformimino-5-aminoimidazole carboxamide ribotide isomerase
MAKAIEGAGLSYLHLVDLDGAKEGKLVNRKVLEQITSQTSLTVDFGGGVRNRAMLDQAFEAGAEQVTVGSLAAREPETFLEWLEIYGPQRLILGADAKNGFIAVSGWQEETTLPVLDFIGKMHEAGVLFVVCTDIAKDGMLSGPSVVLYQEILKSFPKLHLVASGGVSTMDDLRSLRNAKLDGAIVGKALYEGHISLNELLELC